ncbi:protein kinase family protein [bacterium]|nr:protein kinase family protein [bacterium]NBX48822.1 protein kinase family protein [bacterium]
MCSLRTTKFLGEGQSSKVYAALNSNRKSMAVKVTVRDVRFAVQPCEIEYQIMNRLHEIVPAFVPTTYGASWCRNFKPGVFKRNSFRPDITQQYVMKMEFFPRGDLHKMLEELHRQKKLTDDILMTVLGQVLTALRQIQKKLPSFRHNDLHLHNILIGDLPKNRVNFYNGYGIQSLGFRCVIYDFNLSVMAGVQNPLLSDPRMQADYGIYPGNSDKYDLHFFLNSMLDWITKHGAGGKYDLTKSFLLRALPAGYQGREDSKVKNHRLRPGVSTNSLASLELIMKDPYFKPMKNLFNAPEEGEVVELPPKRGPATGPIKTPPARPPKPPLQLLTFPKPVPAKKNENNNNGYVLPPNVYKSAKWQALLNLMTEPGPNRNEWNKYKNELGRVQMHLVNAERQKREKKGRDNVRREFVKMYKAQGIPSYVPPPKKTVSLPEYKPLVLPPPVVVTRPVPPKATTFEEKYKGAFRAPGYVRPETKVLAPKNAPPMTEVKAPKFVAPKPLPISSVFKSVENLLKIPNREPFMHKMNMGQYKSGPAPRIQLDKTFIKCESLDREMLNMMAEAHGLNPRLYKSKQTLCQALKRLHNGV